MMTAALHPDVRDMPEFAAVIARVRIDRDTLLRLASYIFPTMV